MTTRAEYLERLRDQLPVREAKRILEEVDGLIQDRCDAELEAGTADETAAEQRALEVLGSPEELASRLIDQPILISYGTRRTFVRTLAIFFAAHLVLSIVLTGAQGEGTGIPGLLGPLPTGSLAATFVGVLSVFLIDTGLLFLLFAFLGRGKAPTVLPELKLRTVVTRRDAVLGLVLLALLALILHPFRDQVFAVRDGDKLVGFLAPDLVAALKFIDVALVLFALRQIVNLWKGHETAFSVGADALWSLVLALGLLYAATRSELVVFPEGGALTTDRAAMLAELVTRVFLLLFVAGALFLTVRTVKRLLRLRQLMG